MKQKVKANPLASKLGFHVPESKTAAESMKEAAPDMLEALEAILNTWDGPLYRHEMGPNIEMARKAIAKAKGE